MPCNLAFARSFIRGVLINRSESLMQVSETKTWLVDESVLAHFESLELEMVCMILRVKLRSNFVWMVFLI